MKILKMVAAILVFTWAASANAGLIHDFTVKSDDGTTVDLTGTLVLTMELPDPTFNFAIQGNQFIDKLFLTGGEAFGLAFSSYGDFDPVAGLFVGSFNPVSMQIVLSGNTNIAFFGSGESLGINADNTICLSDGCRITQIVSTAFLLSPRPETGVPAPATLALFGLGLAVLGISRRKRITRP